MEEIQETSCHSFLQLRSSATLAPDTTFGNFHQKVAFPLQKPNTISKMTSLVQYACFYLSTV